MRRTFEVPCLVDIEQTADSLHAHAIPQGIEICPGDTVQVHGAPGRLAYGERLHLRCSATVTRAGTLGRKWAQLRGLLHLVELCDVGFRQRSPHETRD